MNRFLDAIRRHISERPDDVFCHFVAENKTQAVSWGDLGRQIGGFASAYRERGLAPGGIVPIFLHYDPALHCGFFAAMMSGLVPCFLPCPSPRQDPAIYWESLRGLLAHLDPAAIVLDRSTLAEMREAGLAVGQWHAILIDDIAAGGDLPVGDLSENSIALLQHSSGTTGRKKGVALSYHAIAAQLDSYGKALGIGADDCIISWLPLYHDMGLVACLLLPAYVGVPFVQLDPFAWVAQPALLFDAIARHRGTLAWLPNFAFEHLVHGVRGGPCDLSSMRAFINCSEPCRPASFDRFLARFSTWGVRLDMLQCCYALAESVFAVSQTQLGTSPHIGAAGSSDRPLMKLGQPIGGIEMSVRDGNGNIAADGEFGEIALRGEFLFEGYYRDPAMTAERLRDGGWYFTRDRGCVVDGELYLAGRLDDLLIINGRNCHAHEIEALIDGLGVTRPGRVAAFTLYDARSGTAGLIVVAERDRDVAVGDAEIIGLIIERIRSILDIQPRDIRLKPPGWVIKTTSGKVSRRDNARKYQAELQPAKEQALAAP